MAPSRIAVRARRRSLVKDLGFPDPRGARSLRRRSHGTRGAVCCGALGPLMALPRHASISLQSLLIDPERTRL